MGSFNKRFNDYAKDGYISAEELRELGKKWSQTKYGRPDRNDQDTEYTSIVDEKGFWKKFKKSYKKKGDDGKLGIAGIKGSDLSKESLVNAFNNPTYGKQEEEESSKSKSKDKSMADFSTYEGSDTQKELQDLIKDSQDAKPSPLLINGASRIDDKGKSQGKLSVEEANERFVSKEYRPDNKLPDRPEVPTLPTLKLPGGITRTLVSNPSGLPGESYRYDAKGKSLYGDKSWNPKNNNYGDKSFKERAEKSYKGRAKTVKNVETPNTALDKLKKNVSRINPKGSSQLRAVAEKMKNPTKHYGKKEKPINTDVLGPSGPDYKPVDPKDSAFRGFIPKTPAPGKGVLLPGVKRNRPGNPRFDPDYKKPSIKDSLPKSKSPGKGVLAPGNKPKKKLSEAFRQ